MPHGHRDAGGAAVVSALLLGGVTDSRPSAQHQAVHHLALAATVLADEEPDSSSVRIGSVLDGTACRHHA